MAPASRRLDELLVERGVFASRSRARDAIVRGTVAVDGRLIRKAGRSVHVGAELSVDDPAAAYVSRSALKLIAGLDAFGFDPAGHHALDLGASTGGFTEVLLERGALQVIAVDVGEGQMAPHLARDLRVTQLRHNARDLTSDDLPGHAAPGVVVCDVSFISLKLALPPALALAAEGALGVFLVKPQFEVGRSALGKGGLVDATAASRAADDLRTWLDAQPGWTTVGLIASPLEGGDGNREFLLGAVKGRG